MHEHWWKALPDLPAVSLLTNFGLIGGLTISFAMFGVVVAITLIAERQRHGQVRCPKKKTRDGTGLLVS